MNRNRLSDVMAGYELARQESESHKLPERRGCSGCLLPWWILPGLCTLCAIGEMIYWMTQGYFK